MHNNSNHSAEDAVGIKLALSEASLGDMDVIFAHLGKSGGVLQAEVERWSPSFDGKMTVFVREGSYFADKSSSNVRSLVVPDKIRLGEISSFLLIGSDICIFEIGSRVYIQTEKEFFIEATRIVNLIGSGADKYRELSRLVELEKNKNA